MSTQEVNAKDTPAETRHRGAEQDAARATVREWIAAGLPDSTWISTDPITQSVSIFVRSRAEVDEWAAAVGRKPYVFHVEGMAYYSLPHDVNPVALKGWSLEVSCHLPPEDTQPPVVKIRLMSAAKARQLRAATA